MKLQLINLELITAFPVLYSFVMVWMHSDRSDNKIRSEHTDIEVDCFLPISGFVKISVFDRQNKELRNFADKVTNPGNYKFHFFPVNGPEEFYYYVAQVYNTDSFSLEFEEKKGIKNEL